MKFEHCGDYVTCWSSRVRSESFQRLKLLIKVAQRTCSWSSTQLLRISDFLKLVPDFHRFLLVSSTCLAQHRTLELRKTNSVLYGCHANVFTHRLIILTDFRLCALSEAKAIKICIISCINFSSQQLPNKPQHKTI